MSPFDLVVRFAGYSASELEGQQWCVRSRRLVLGLMVMGSAGFASVMLAAALSRIDASSPARWLYAPLGGLVYFTMLAGFDSIFVASTEPARRGSAVARVILSIVVTAFSAITMDALIAGDRLLAEIDLRRVNADLEIQAQHRAVHGMDAKTAAANQAAGAVAQIEKDLAGDPQTAAFVEAQSNASSTATAFHEAQRTLEPRLTETRSAIAELKRQLASMPDSETAERQTATTRLAGLRVQREALEAKLRGTQQAADSAAAVLADLRQEWRSDRATALQRAHQVREAAQVVLKAAGEGVERDAADSRRTNARAFKANLVEEMTAFWALAGRDMGYLVIGIVVWAGAMAFELLAILTKILLKPDELDRHRQQRAALAALEAEIDSAVWSEVGALHHADAERSRLGAKALIEALRSRQSAAEAASTMVMDAFVTLQHRKLSTTDSRLQASLDAHFEALQRGIDAEMAATVAAAPAPTVPAHPDPVTAAAVPAHAASSSHTIVL